MRAARSAVAPTSSGSARCSARARALAPPRAVVGRRLPAVVPSHWANSGRPSPDGHHPPGRAVEAICAF
ncbi:putative proline-rich receptor-like protein kinase PERK13 [Iris pallida]|uniref:Proline-rich receptor-like protein kinase PERK13 n=1 Tax=Iris pallida TaxID=29817 RepID=A0AAX6DYZ5_IRIPA|nr:putative proline-rich receptor-like protein kinase PERK13 [Iris pallida]